MDATLAILIAGLIGAGASLVIAFFTARANRALPNSIGAMPLPDLRQLLRWFFVVLLCTLGAVLLIIAGIGILVGQEVDRRGFLIVLAIGAAILVVAFLGHRFLMRRPPQSN